MPHDNITITRARTRQIEGAARVAAHNVHTQLLVLDAADAARRPDLQITENGQGPAGGPPETEGEVEIFVRMFEAWHRAAWAYNDESREPNTPAQRLRYMLAQAGVCLGAKVEQVRDDALQVVDERGVLAELWFDAEPAWWCWQTWIGHADDLAEGELLGPDMFEQGETSEALVGYLASVQRSSKVVAGGYCAESACSALHAHGLSVSQGGANTLDTLEAMAVGDALVVAQGGGLVVRVDENASTDDKPLAFELRRFTGDEDGEVSK